MTFNGICLITNNVKRVRVFYETVLRTSFKGDDAFAWIEGSRGTFSIFSNEGTERMAPGSMSGADHGSYTIEFEVDDVDHEFERLKSLCIQFVKEPTKQSWRRQSVWFRVPDGNIVNFYKLIA
jgi:catechol 2,3-dioxygenase-like lactoylglutathione lyase family enzyme